MLIRATKRLAESFEAAREGAHRLKVRYMPEEPSAGFDSAGATTVAAKDVSSKHQDPEVGNALTAFAGTPVTVDRHYATPTQHHNPIELFTTSCAWTDGKLTVWEGSQNVTGIKNGLAEQLAIDPEQVRVISPFIGGAFGSRGSLTQRTALIAVAARRLNRPVKLVVTRDQGYTIASYRAETRHHVKLGANRDGKLLALIHEGEEVTSRPDNYMVAGTDASSRLYACLNVASKVSLVHADRNTRGTCPPQALEAQGAMGGSRKVGPVRPVYNADRLMDALKGTGGRPTRKSAAEKRATGLHRTCILAVLEPRSSPCSDPRSSIADGRAPRDHEPTA
jgi:xanthine dehydrogenase YagR molybdenum-binding subunit